MMIFSIAESRDILRLDGTDNDGQIMALVAAIPDYLAATTGYRAAGEFSPVAKTAGRFILQQWYYGENADTDKLQRVVDCLLKALSAERDISWRNRNFTLARHGGGCPRRSCYQNRISASVAAGPPKSHITKYISRRKIYLTRKSR
jgi:hypothetical protein